MLIWKILKEALDKNASDIIISPNSYPSLKINWEIVFFAKLWNTQKRNVKRRNFMNNEKLTKRKVFKWYGDGFLNWFERVF